METTNPNILIEGRPLVAASSCLLGQAVRYDGTAKRHDTLTQILGKHLNLQPICPEQAIGLGVPRAPIQAVIRQGKALALGVDDPNRNVSAPLRAYAASIAEQAERLCGYVFKARSPSCGLGSVPLHNELGEPVGIGNGLFSDTLTRLQPLLPCIDEQELDQPEPRDRFLRQVFARYSWHKPVSNTPSQSTLERFHAHYKYTLMAYSPRHYRELGRLVSSRQPLHQKLVEYSSGLQHALTLPNQTGRHLNALEHLFGYISNQLTEHQRSQFKAAIIACQDQHQDWRTIWWQLRTLCQQHPHSYVSQSHYLYPCAEELALRFPQTH